MVFEFFEQMDLNNLARFKGPETMKSISLLINQSLLKIQETRMLSMITSLTAG